MNLKGQTLRHEEELQFPESFLKIIRWKMAQEADVWI
jgi:hypothetical protein